MSRVYRKKKDGKPYGKYYLLIEVTGPDGGRRRVGAGRSFDTKKEAIAALAEIETSRNRGNYVEPSNQTVRDFVAEWLPAMRGRVSPTTWAERERHCRLNIIPSLGDVPLQKLTKEALEIFYVKLTDTGRANGKGGLSPKTVRNISLTMHCLLQSALTSNRIQTNVANVAKPPREKHRAAGEQLEDDPQDNAWGSQQLRAFLAAVEDDPLAPLFELAARTGMRRGELVGLRWKDVDLDVKKQIQVRQTLVIGATYSELHFRGTKSGKQRTIGLDPSAIATLRKRKKQQTEERMLFGSAWEDTGLVFTQPAGGPLHPQSVSQSFERAVKRSGIPPITFHGLRHTHATILLGELQVPVHVVSKRLGHASVAFTMDIYSHVLPHYQQDAADAFGALMGE